MSQSIGQKLTAARKRRDLTIEDVAHETRIHFDTLRHLEADDYSHFANFTYAKSFLSMYGRHLGIDMTDYLREFRPTDNGSSQAPEPLESPANGSAGADVFAPVADLQRYRPVVAIVIFFAIVCTIPGMYFIGRGHGMKAANRIARDEAHKAAIISQDGMPPSPAATVAPPSPPPEPIPAPRPPRPPVVTETIDPAPAAKPVTPPVMSVEPSGPVEVRRPAVVIEDPPSEVKKAEPFPPDN